MRICLEIVDEINPAQVKLAFKDRLLDDPRQIGSFHTPLVYRPGNPKTGGHDGVRMLALELMHRRLQAGKIAAMLYFFNNR